VVVGTAQHHPDVEGAAFLLFAVIIAKPHFSETGRGSLRAAAGPGRGDIVRVTAARLVAQARGYKPGWLWHRLQDPRESGGDAL
jgi:hypothetical protein